MLIQHILTEEIFSAGLRRRRFPPREQHREGALRAGGDVLHRRRQEAHPEGPRALLRRDPARPPRRSPATTRSRRFLKVIYENFYKVYNPKAADRLGVVYTPERDRALHDRERRLAVREAFRQPDRQGRRNPRPRDRHRHLHLRAAGALSRQQGRSSGTSTRRNCTPTRWRSCPTTSPT